jgi:EF-P beta-lysylation protein EpmB
MHIIPVTEPAQQPPRWQTLLSQAITEPAELLRELGLSTALLPAAARAGGCFALRVPRGFVARMRHGDPHDPLLRQVLPLGEELDEIAGYSHDPLRELEAMPVPGLLHKYRGRVLLTTTGACAVHCRYCFRRHYPYAEANPNRDWQQTLDYLQAHTEVDEVILSGGDPLTLGDNRLGRLVTALAAIPHLRRLRIHTRVPVVLPERVDGGLVDWLQGTRLQTVIVIHCNHPNEIDTTVQDALRRLQATRACLLNQSVLLRGVNDRADTLAALSERLISSGVLPYYLHQLDPVQGAAHFSVPDKTAKEIIKQLVAIMPGYLVPRLVREQAGESAKTPL